MQKINYTNYIRPSDFLKMAEGDNIVRILTEGFMANIYGMKTSKGWLRFGETVDPAMKAKYGKTIEPKRRWIWIGINRATGQIGILEVGPIVGNAICELAKERGLDPRDFDVCINRTGKETRTSYKVTAQATSKDISPEVMEKAKKEISYLLDKHFK
jgi:hypothetical protein